MSWWEVVSRWVRDEMEMMDQGGGGGRRRIVISSVRA